MSNPIKAGHTPEVVMLMIDRKVVAEVAAAFQEGSDAIKYDAAEASVLLGTIAMKLEMEAMAAEVSYGPASTKRRTSPVKPRSNVLSMAEHRERKAR
jgi:hypothetical protein